MLSIVLGSLIFAIKYIGKGIHRFATTFVRHARLVAISFCVVLSRLVKIRQNDFFVFINQRIQLMSDF
jgi:hypothetical protein